MEGFDDRLEILTTLFETKTDHRHRSFKIERDEEGRPHIAEELQYRSAGGGRFSTLLHAVPSGTLLN
jgi:hypothetical protein